MEKLKHRDMLSRAIFQEDSFDPNESNELK